ncbi:unnamed protein product [Fraxinus pennsylvanica]|uniref:Uncharacterized protein n=1 Tax=Fraxinus pennsylvanica TaxID=56036 RepID=A0AAD1ZUY7_9LAMI|nr:unnamed protein product [Fraxinus pennsylvanica]
MFFLTSLLQLRVITSVGGPVPNLRFTVNDDRSVTEELLSANFLIPPDENMYSGKSIAELCCDSLKDFNPMVRVSVQKGDLLNFDVDFFDKFDVVVVSSCSLSTKVWS